MAFCPNCGSQAQGAFCPNCGQAVAGGPSAGPTPGAASPAAPMPVAQSGLEPHIAAALCYTPFAIGLIASIIFLLVAPFNQNKFVRFSAFQSLFLHLGIFVLSIVMGIVATIIIAVLHVLGFLLAFLWPLLWLGILIVMLYLMYKAFNNQSVKLPFIGDLAEKQA